MKEAGALFGLLCAALASSGCSHGPTLTRDDLGRQVGDLREEVRLLREQNKALAAQVEHLSRTEPLQTPAGATPIVAPAPGPAPSPPAVAPAPPAPPSPKPAAPASPPQVSQASGAKGEKAQGPESLYREALELYRTGQGQKASELFAAFLRDYPRSTLANNAQYWLGECFYDQKDYTQALENFKLVAERYPTGVKVPDALFKRGVCEKRLGRDAEALQCFRAVVDRFPGTDAADRAKAALEMP